MKKSKSLLVLLAVLVLAVALFLTATLLAERESENGDDLPSTEIVYIDVDEEAVSSFSYTDKEKSFRISHSGNTYTLTDDEAFPLDQTIASYMATTVANITFLRQFDAEVDTSEFGFDDDAAVITATYTDGTDLHLTLGNYNKYADAYYCRLENGTVYLIDSTFTDYFAYSIKDLLLDETVTAPANGLSDVTKIELAYRDGSAFSYVYVLAETDEDGEETAAALWQKVSADGTVLDGDHTETVTEIYNELFKVKLTDWVDYNAVGDRLADYGLDTPHLTVTVRYTKTVEIAGDDATSTVTKKQEVVVGFLIGNAVTAAPSADVTAPADSADTAADSSAETSTGAATDAPTEPSHYFLLEGGKVVYVLTDSSLPTLLGDNG